MNPWKKMNVLWVIWLGTLTLLSLTAIRVMTCRPQLHVLRIIFLKVMLHQQLVREEKTYRPFLAICSTVFLFLV